MKEELEQKRKNINSFDDLINFLQYVKNNCDYGYGVAPRSIAQASLAVAWYLAKEFGITGFQASFVMWDFIKSWSYEDNKCGLKIVDYDNMLYPQYEDKFDKVIPKETWELLQKQAEQELKESGYYANLNVVDHWSSIMNGRVPFGYKVKD